jgi:hypothetical protein|tara:strand:+ start:5232 stop:5450 length:219 start_codon:yes stop_codon:yes gene_type:complete
MAEAEAKTKKFTRTVKPVYVVMQVKDDSGNVISLTKENVEILSTHKNADDLLTILDSGGLPHGSFYKRIALS